MKRLAVLVVGLSIATGCQEGQVVSSATPKPAPKPAANLTRQFAVPVLMYHRVCDLTPKEERSPLVRDLTVSPEDFEAQVKYLADEGFTFLLARDVEDALREGRPLPEKAVAITLDDGYRDNFTHAFPILRKYGARVTIFLVTDNFGRRGRLSWDDVRTMQRAAVGYGSHTVSHPDLTALPLERMRFELRESKRLLEQGLGTGISSVAYPAGKYSSVVTFEAKEAGYLAGWKKGGGPVEPRNAADPYRLPRVRVHGRTTLRDFERKVWSGVYAQRMRRDRLLAKR